MASGLDERQIAETIRSRISERRRPVTRPLVLVAAAASVLVALVGVEWVRDRPVMEPVVSAPLVHHAPSGVILVVREGKTPMYVLTESVSERTGDEQ
jgi:hypothetical protein